MKCWFSMNALKPLYSTLLCSTLLGSLLGACGTTEDGALVDAGPSLIDAGPPLTIAAELSLALQPIKTFHFTWSDVPGATHYKLLENADGASEFIHVADDVTAAQESIDHIVPLYARVNAKYILQSCNANVCIDSATFEVTGTLQEAIGYMKASNSGVNDRFGWALALSSDGQTLAVGAPFEDSDATGIGMGENDNSTSAGAVYVFSRSGNSWVQQAYVKASNTDAADYFGEAVALSSDGNTLAVGSYYEDSSTTGIGIGEDNLASDAGAVYVFSRSGGSWAQQAYIKASNTDAADHFGGALALSSDGQTLAVGATNEDSDATGIDMEENDNSASDAGAVYVFSRSGSGWAQQAYVKASNTDANDRFGWALALSSDGKTLAVAAYFEDSNATGIGMGEDDNSAIKAGAVYVFFRSGSNWAQQAYVKASNTDANDWFGVALALSSDGNTLAVGAANEDSAGIGMGEDDNSTSNAGAVYVFSRSSSNWAQQAYMKASNTDENDSFGRSLALSLDGKILVAGAPSEGSDAMGIGMGEDDNSASDAGAVYVFFRSGSNWAQQAHVKASNTEAGDFLGDSVAISDDGTLAVGASGEDSSAVGSAGNADDNSASLAGAVYLY